MTSPKVTRWRSAAVLLALSVGAAACGTTETSTTPTLATQAPSTEASNDAPESNDVPDPTAPGAEGTEGSAAEDEAAAPAVNLFPDTDVLNIADGGTVNLASELGGGDKATLLWFFAPH